VVEAVLDLAGRVGDTVSDEVFRSGGASNPKVHPRLEEAVQGHRNLPNQ
jgi:hypothetical protein